MEKQLTFRLWTQQRIQGVLGFSIKAPIAMEGVLDPRVRGKYFGKGQRIYA